MMVLIPLRNASQLMRDSLRNYLGARSTLASANVIRGFYPAANITNLVGKSTGALLVDCRRAKARLRLSMDVVECALYEGKTRAEWKASLGYVPGK